MKKNFIKTILVTAALLQCTAVFAQAQTQSKKKYISPNNDGEKDALTVPFKVADDRLITSWSLVIENSRGKIVRTIGNKVSLPSTVSFDNIIKQIGKAKEGVILPPSVTWNGVLDDGTTAPDGEYFYYITVTDDKDKVGVTQKKSVIVDNTKPDVKVQVPNEATHIFGGDDKPTFPIKQKGSKEDLWIATIIDANKNIVRTMRWENSAPLTFEWNGTDDKGIIVPDGAYTYSITAEDKAGNVAPNTEVKDIYFSAEKPATNITISGTKYFSANSDKNKIVLDVTIPEPRANSGNRLVHWQVDIVDSSGKVVRTYNKDTTHVEKLNQILFDGKDSKGMFVAEGSYQARVSAEYLNGYKPNPVASPSFVFDSTAPTGSVRVSDDVFSPDGDGRKDTITISQIVMPDNGSPIKNWKGKIVSANDSSDVVMEYDFGDNPPKEFSWGGLDKNGNMALDGSYDYILSATDMAGNSFEVKTNNSFRLDTSKTEIMLAKSEDAFSPNGDGVQDEIIFTPVLKSGTSVVHYLFEIRNSSNQVVFNVEENNSIPKNISWNGKDKDGNLCPDGTYTADIVIDSANGAKSNTVTQSFDLDTTAPYLVATAPYTVFSPDGDGKQDMFKLYTDHNVPGDKWYGTIFDRRGNPIRVYQWSMPIGPSKPTIEWNGTDENGNKVPDGEYRLEIKSKDKAGNSFSTEIKNITMDTRDAKAYVTTLYPGISPISENKNKAQNFHIKLSLEEGIASWAFDVRKENGESVRSWSSENNKNLPVDFIWDGLDKNAKPIQGTFTGTLVVKYVKGNEVTAVSSPFLCSVTPPVLSVKTAPEYFSPDNDGTDDDLFIELSGVTSSKLVKWSFTINNPNGTEAAGTPFWLTSGTEKITERIIWNGLSNVSKDKKGRAERVQSAMDYPWVFTATDSLGMSTTLTGVIPVDILVIRDGDVLKMAVPSIIFRSNSADFKTAKEAPGSKVTKEQADNNQLVLKRVAEILKKFPDYTVTIVGHANNTTGKANEETILVPLSASRSEFVKERLVANGITASRLSTEGKGGKEPVAAFDDKSNWWKNRRVEFILKK